MTPSIGKLAFVMTVCLRVSAIGDNQYFHFSHSIKIPKSKDTGVYVFDWRLRLSVTQCMKVCNITKVCQFFNYETRPHLCGLIRIDESSKVEVEQKPGYVYGNKSEWKQNNANKCDKCDDTGRCNNDDLTDKKNDVCRNSGCKAPTGTDVKGNMFSAGSKVKCKVGHQKLPFNVNFEETKCAENGTWRPFSCLNSFRGSYYLLHRADKTWYEAKAFCESQYGHLADINSAEENAFITSAFTSDQSLHISNIWIGGNDLEEEGIWRWSDSSLINWIGVGPDNSKGIEHCLQFVIHGFYSTEWNDNNCFRRTICLCEIK